KTRIFLLGLFWLATLPTAFAQPLARVQIIHNSADHTLGNIDLWIDGNQWIDNLPFREATAYLDIPAGVPLRLGVAPENSAMVQDTLVSVELNLQPHDTLIVHVYGLTDPTAYQPFVPLTMQVINQRREFPNFDHNQIDLFFLFGSTDEGRVDIRQ